MPSIFTRIINGELPGHFVWRDDLCIAIMTIAPLKPGHVLVIPREEIDHWLDLPQALLTHLHQTAQTISKALQTVYQPKKVGLMIAGLEVPHVHLHLVPIDQVHDLDFKNATETDATQLAAEANKIQAALAEQSST